MVVIRADEQVEGWLGRDAASWRLLSDGEYRAATRAWREAFGWRVEARAGSRRGHDAIEELGARLPCDALLFNGVKVTSVANTGGGGWPTAYRAAGLRGLDRGLANHRELIVAAADLAWCCVFTHESGAFAWEALFERDPSDPPGL